MTQRWIPVSLLAALVGLSTGMSGQELAITLQSLRPEILVVLVSGNVNATILEGLRPNSASFLPKPFKPSDVIGVIDELRERAGVPPLPAG